MAATIAALLFNEDDEDDRDEDELFVITLMACMAQDSIRHKRPRIEGYVDLVIPKYANATFRRMFRLSGNTFRVLLEKLKTCPELHFDSTGGRLPVSPETQLYLSLWYFGGKDTIVKVADRFNVSESSVILSRNRIMAAIINNFNDKFICWPKDEGLILTEEQFQRRNGFPGILGALDGTHIAIKAPSNNPQSYINRKKFHSLQLQAVCDCNMLFTDCFVGYPGSCHDARVLRNSDLWQNGETWCTEGKYVIADAAYPLKRWLLTPYKDNGYLILQQKHYNRLHSCNRVVIERCFGLLKGRFRRLQYIDTKSVATAVKIIMTCCLLHNICLMNHDAIEDFQVEDEDAGIPQDIQLSIDGNDIEGVITRNRITRELYCAKS